MSELPSAAVEAAHKAWREQARQDGSIFEYNLRAALEAAAPFIAATAWDGGQRLSTNQKSLPSRREGWWGVTGENAWWRRALCKAGFHQRLETTYPWGRDYYCSYCGNVDHY